VATSLGQLVRALLEIVELGSPATPILFEQAEAVAYCKVQQFLLAHGVRDPKLRVSYSFDLPTKNCTLAFTHACYSPKLLQHCIYGWLQTVEERRSTTLAQYLHNLYTHAKN